MEATVPCSEGVLAGDVDADIPPLGIVERHGANAGIGRGFAHYLGLDRSTVGSTVAHHAHNLVVTGTSHEALATVANHLRRIGGV